MNLGNGFGNAEGCVPIGPSCGYSVCAILLLWMRRQISLYKYKHAYKDTHIYIYMASLQPYMWAHHWGMVLAPLSMASPLAPAAVIWCAPFFCYGCVDKSPYICISIHIWISLYIYGISAAIYTGSPLGTAPRRHLVGTE